MIPKKPTVAVVFLVCLQCGICQDRTSFDWCDPDLDCGGIKNSMCYLPMMKDKNTCFFMEDVMTAEDKRMLLAMHNTLRDQLAAGEVSGWPSAADMRQMTWDDTLAAQATMWAFQCNFTDSDPCPKHPYFPRAGQTSIQVGNTDDYPDVTTVFNRMVTPGKNGDQMVDKWDPNNAKEGSRNFHQIIYARQTAVGCGLIRFLQTKKESDKSIAIFSLSLWCNYGIGLQAGEPVYTKGETCSKCPDNTKCRSDSTYSHLCAKADEPIYGTFTDLSRKSNGRRINPTFLISVIMVMFGYFFMQR